MFTLEFRLKSNGALTPEKKIQAALVIASSLYEVNFNTTGATQVFLAEQRKDLLLEFKVIDQTSSRNPSKQGELALVITCQNIGANEATPDLVVNFIRAILVETELNQLFELALTKLAGLEKHNQLGVEFYKVQQYAEAAIFFEKACHLAKNDDERLTPLFNWGKALSALKKAQEASEKFKAVLALDENLKTNPKIKLKHQEAYADNLKIMGEFKEAVTVYKTLFQDTRQFTSQQRLTLFQVREEAKKAAGILQKYDACLTQLYPEASREEIRRKVADMVGADLLQCRIS